MKFAIRTEGLSRRFGKTVAVDAVDLEVPEGAIYALVGANGAGKTTIIKMLMNIFSPTSGPCRDFWHRHKTRGGKRIQSHRLCLGEPGDA